MTTPESSENRETGGSGTAESVAAPTLESAVIEAAVDLYRFYVEESLEDADEEDCVKHAEAMLGQVFCERVRAYTEATS